MTEIALACRPHDRRWSSDSKLRQPHDGRSGFNPHGVLTFSMNVPGRVQMEVVQGAQGKPERRPTYAPMAAFFRDLEERIGTVSSVESLATTTSLPLIAGPGGIVVVFTLPGQSGRTAMRLGRPRSRR